jgi:hypothetical protein
MGHDRSRVSESLTISIQFSYVGKPILESDPQAEPQGSNPHTFDYEYLRVAWIPLLPEGRKAEDLINWEDEVNQFVRINSEFFQMIQLDVCYLNRVGSYTNTPRTL